MEKPSEINILTEVLKRRKNDENVVKQIWEAFSLHILNLIKENKSIHVKEFGTFTFSRWSLETGIRKELKHFKAAFVLSKSFLDFDVVLSRPLFIDDKVPTGTINYTILAEKCNTSKNKVKQCVDEIIQCARKIANYDKDFVLELPGLGILLVRNREANFVFANDCSLNPTKPNLNCYRAASTYKPYIRRRIPCRAHDTIIKKN